MSDVLVPDSPVYVYLDRYTTDDSDSLAYDNETVRYDYDVVKGGPHDDVNGRGGVGYTTEDTDVYVSGHFDEGTGNVGGRVDLEHAISPDTILDAHFAADNEEHTDGHVGLTHFIDDNEVVRGELGNNASEGDYLDVGYERGLENGTDRINFHGSENGGSALEYNGDRHGEDWDANASIRATDEGEITGTLSGEKRFSLDDDTDARVYGEASLDGSWRAGGEMSHLIGDDAMLNQGLEIDHKGNADGYVSHVHGYNHETIGVHLNPEGEESYTYNGHHESGNWKTDEVLTVDKDGKVDGQVAGSYENTLSENRTHIYDGVIRADGSWEAGVNTYDRLSDNVDAHNEIRYNSDGKLSGNHDVVVTTLDGSGYVGAGAGWDSEGGRNASVSGGYQLDNGSNVNGELGWDGKNYRGSASTGVAVSENTTFESGLSFDQGSKTVGVNAGVGYENPEAKTSLGVGVGYSANPDFESSYLAGDMAFGDVLGAGSSIGLGVVAEEDIYRRKEAMPQSGLEASLRAEVLAQQPEGSTFVEYGARRKLSGEFGTSFSIGAGYVEAGLSAGEEYDIRFVKLTQDPRLGESPTELEMKPATTAADVLGMKPGESFSITGGSHQGVRGGGGLGFSYGALGVSGGIDAGLMVSGRLSTEVLRGSEGSARLVLSKADGKTADTGLKVTVGLSPEALVGDALPVIPDTDPKGPILGVFFQLLMSIIGRFFSFGGRLGAEGSDGDNRLVDVALDLSKPDVQKAYDKAIKGDWSDIEKMARDGHPGVDMDRSIFTDVTRKSVPFALNAFGFFFNRESAETQKDSDVVTDNGTYEIESDHDQNTQSRGGIFKKTSYTVSDFTRDVELVDGEMAGVKGEEHWLSWQREHKDTFSSREEVSEQLSLARLLGDEGTRQQIDAYRARMSDVKDRRKLWVGPRNEMRRTTVSTKVVVSDDGLDQLAGMKLDALWSAYASNWKALNPNKPAPLWLSSAGREFLHQESDALDALLEQSEMLMIENTLEEMVHAAAVPNEEKRHDAIRKTLFGEMGDEALVASVAQLAGKEHVKLSLEVDSAAGSAGMEHDLMLTQMGEDFDVQRHVFGQQL